MTGILLLGNGPAANRLLHRLHRHGHPEPVTVLGAEPWPAYNRAVLGSVLAGGLDAGLLTLPDPPPGTVTRLGVRALGIDRERRLVFASDGEAYPYRRLVLATGAASRLPAALTGAAGRPAAGVYPIRERAGLPARIGRAVAVVGGGPLGVELALALRRAGSAGPAVLLVESGPYPIHRHLDPLAGELLGRLLADRGVDVRAGRTVAGHRPGRLLLDDGTVWPVETVLVCAGVRPRTELARAAGLPVRTGVLVDDRLATADPAVYAIGDCAELGDPGAQPGEPGTQPGEPDIRPGDPDARPGMAGVATAGSATAPPPGGLAAGGPLPGALPPGGPPAGGLAAAFAQADDLARILTGEPIRHRPTRPVLRLRAAEMDLVAIGPTRRPEPGARSVTLLDRVGGRYAWVTLRDRRVSAAVVLGLPRAIAALTQLYDTDQPVPAGWYQLLSGLAADRVAEVELPDDAVICVCNNVTKEALVRAWRDDGARDLAGLAAATRATTGCGRCAGGVQRLCAWLARQRPVAGATAGAVAG